MGYKPEVVKIAAMIVDEGRKMAKEGADQIPPKDEAVSGDAANAGEASEAAAEEGSTT